MRSGLWRTLLRERRLEEYRPPQGYKKFFFACMNNLSPLKKNRIPIGCPTRGPASGRLRVGRALLYLIDDEAFSLHLQRAAGGVHFSTQGIQNIPHRMRECSFTCPRSGVDGDDQLFAHCLLAHRRADRYSPARIRYGNPPYCPARDSPFSVR